MVIAFPHPIWCIDSNNHIFSQPICRCLYLNCIAINTNVLNVIMYRIANGVENEMQEQTRNTRRISQQKIGAKGNQHTNKLVCLNFIFLLVFLIVFFFFVEFYSKNTNCSRAKISVRPSKAESTLTVGEYSGGAVRERNLICTLLIFPAIGFTFRICLPHVTNTCFVSS